MGTIITSIKKRYGKVDWNLLIFLLLFLNVKLVVKVIGLCFIYLRRFNFSFGFSFRISRLPLFYPLMIAIAVLNFLLLGLFKDPRYCIMMAVGISFWIACILASHQVKLAVEKTGLEKIHQAVILFFVINAVASFINLFAIILETGELNPYRYQGMYQKYFIGTGDYIRGITFDTSTANAILNAFGVVYFLSRKQMVMTLLCMVVLLLTCSNFTNLLMITCLAYMFVFRTGRDQKSVIIVHLALLVIFITNVSPQNDKYAIDIIDKMVNGQKPPGQKIAVKLPVELRPDSDLSADQRKYKIAKLYLDSLGKAGLSVPFPGKTAVAVFVPKPEIPKANIHAPEYQHKHDTSDSRLQVIKLSQQLKIDTLASVQQINPQKVNGKIAAIRQTVQFLKQHPFKIITGAGMGNFSSKLAFRASGLQIAGGYPQKYIYINKDFEENHLFVYLDYFSKDTGLHSVSNTPNDVYSQLISEYGVAGLVAFVVFYIMYFLKHARRLTYGFPLLLLLLGAFCIEYWYEQLSIVVMFELFLFLNIKENQDNREDTVLYE